MDSVALFVNSPLFTALLTLLISEISVPVEDDSEFDLIAAADPVPEIQPATVFRPRNNHDGVVDHFLDVTHGTVSEMVDSRISIFTEMGFSAEEAVTALQRSNNDVNEALTMLLSSK